MAIMLFVSTLTSLMSTKLNIHQEKMSHCNCLAPKAAPVIFLKESLKPCLPSCDHGRLQTCPSVLERQISKGPQEEEVKTVRPLNRSPSKQSVFLTRCQAESPKLGEQTYTSRLFK
jgi:hypothetical protein